MVNLEIDMMNIVSNNADVMQKAYELGKVL